MTKKISLSIFLSKKNAQLKDCVDFEGIDPPTPIEIAKNKEYSAVAYLGNTIPSQPQWIEFLDIFASDTGKESIRKTKIKTFSLSSIIIYLK